MKYPSLLSRFPSLLSIGVALGAALLSVAPARAATYSETGDAGDLTSSAQAVTGATGATPLTAITGTLTKVAGISEADMFQIYIGSPSTFSATTTFSPGVNNFDTQLFLFTLGGIGILANDDDPDTGGPQSALPVGAFTGPAGYYDLLITGSGKYPGSSGGLIFPNQFDADNDDATGVYGPTGSGGGSPLSRYIGSSNEGGNYSIALTGAQFGPAAAAVPEPSTIVIFVSGLALLYLARRRRPVFSFSNAFVSPL